MQKALRVLEFDKVIEQMKQHAASSLGVEKVESLTPSKDIEEVNRLQAETDEGAKVVRLKGSAPLGGIHDVRTSLKRAQIGSPLTSGEFLDIADTLNGGRRLKTFILNMVENDIELPILQDYMTQLVEAEELEGAIRLSVDGQGDILDSASEALRKIRRQIRNAEAKTRDKLEEITRSSNTRKMLSDTVITLRNDRFVIPVKQEYRGSFGGMVHDQSSSGATLFIEPASVVDINNQLREAKVKEKQEIEKILADLTRQTAEQADALFDNIEVLAAVDFIFAKAHYAQALKASKPKINTGGSLSFKRARHPLIAADDVVPIDVKLGGGYSSLIITGPNTGGKTVTLKTMGLLTIMAQSGLQIPAQDGSTAAIFQSVFADIGDEQSIEQNLSTFSSHMTNIIDILKNVDLNSLVLFDELGAGTDPEEGAALAIAILDHVTQLGARVAATTHYSELKAYAYEREGILNASVEFDVETLRPTYRLLLGVPGRSNAFDISRRLGMDDGLIQKAKQQISSDTNKVDHMIASLEKNQKQAEKDRREAGNILRETDELREDLNRKINTLESERERILQKADRQGKEAVAAAKQQSEAVIAELRDAQRRGGPVKEHEFIDARRRIDELEPTFSKTKPSTASDRRKSYTFQPGDEVNVESLDRKGHIVEKLDGNEYLVQLGIMKMNVDARDLRSVAHKEEAPARSIVSVKGSASHIKTELDLRGKRYEEAMADVEKYLDDALLAGYQQVSIIHGKGTGALRGGVTKLLKNHAHVKDTRSGGMGEGGSGVTIVQLK